MGDAEKRLREWLTKYQQRGTLTDEARGHLDALMAEHSVALSRARAEALEEAKQRILRRCCEKMKAHGFCEHQPCDYYQNALTEIQALIATPAPATIPVERVREVLRRMLETMPDDALLGIHSAAHELGVDLDAKGKKAPQVCECGHDEGWHHYGKKRGCMKKMDDRTTCVCKAWHPAEASP